MSQADSDVEKVAGAEKKGRKGGSGSHVWPASKLSAEVRALQARVSSLEASAPSTTSTVVDLAPSLLPVPGSRSFAEWVPDALVALVNSRGQQMAGWEYLPDSIEILRIIWAARMFMEGCSDEEVVAFDKLSDGMRIRSERYAVARRERLMREEEEKQRAMGMEYAGSADYEAHPQAGSPDEMVDTEAQRQAVEALFANRGYEVAVERAERE